MNASCHTARSCDYRVCRQRIFCSDMIDCGFLNLLLFFAYLKASDANVSSAK